MEGYIIKRIPSCPVLNRKGAKFRFRSAKRLLASRVLYFLIQLQTSSSAKREKNMDTKPENCWEYKKCGRGVGGRKVDELGICPAALEEKWNGVNGGKNAGRFCWFVAGTYCENTVQGTFAMKYRNCTQCAFFQKVEKEAGKGFVFIKVEK